MPRNNVIQPLSFRIYDNLYIELIEISTLKPLLSYINISALYVVLLRYKGIFIIEIDVVAQLLIHVLPWYSKCRPMQ